MRTPAAAIAWQLFARYRWYWVAGIAYFVAVAILCQVLPECPFANAVRYCLAVPLVAMPVGVFITLAIGSDGDMADRDSVYPKRMFTLPVAARTLVAWPMFLGAATMLVVCLALGQWVVRTLWPEAPLWRPTLLLTACLAWFQTLQWVPFGLRWLRVGIALAAIGALVSVPALVGMVEPPGVWLDVVLAAQIPLACGVAIRGVCRARCGDGPDWRWILNRIRGLSLRHHQRSRPFRSASQAQRWLEWRLHSTGLFIAIGIGTAFLLVGILYCSPSPAAKDLPIFVHPASLLLLPLLVALMAGPAFGQCCSQHAKSTACSSFLATRPIDCAGLVRAKFTVAIAGALVMYALTVPLAAALMIGLQDYQGLEQVMAHVSSPAKQVVVRLAALVLLPAATWTLIATNMFVSLTGRKWVIVVFSIVGMGLFYTILCLGIWISLVYPEFIEAMVTLAPWLLGGLAAVKLASAAWVLRVLCRRRLLGETTAVRLVGLWLAVVVGLLLLAAWLLPGNLFAWPVVVSCVVLAVPAVRIGLAPLALAWNRHR